MQEQIYNSTFYPNLLAMLSAFIALAVIVIILVMLASKRYTAAYRSGPGESPPNIIPLVAAATVTGIGLGGFADGIVFHQILQWHQVLSAKINTGTVTGKSVNMFWDGIFHLFTLVVTFVGVVLMWRLLFRTNINRSGYLMSGGLLLGWGLFNLVEGVIDHQVLRLHNVYEYSIYPWRWNYAFLGFSFVLLVAGGLLIRAGRRRHHTLTRVH